MLMLGLKGIIRAHIEAIFSFFPILACLKLILMHFFSVCFPENKMKLVLFDYYFVRNFDLSALSSKYKAPLM